MQKVSPEAVPFFRSPAERAKGAWLQLVEDLRTKGQGSKVNSSKVHRTWREVEQWHQG